jgi:8-oxo-dGTP diphosphatase
MRIGNQSNRGRGYARAVERRRRIGAYGLVRDRHGRVLLVRALAGDGGAGAGPWELPGGDVAHGEHPERAAVRTASATTGRRTKVIAVHEVLTDIDAIPGTPAGWHHDRIVFELALVDRDADRRQRRSDPLSAAEWFEPAQLDHLELAPYAARVLNVPGAPVAVIDQSEAGPADGVEEPRPGNLRRQRFAAYGLVTNPTGDVLLTLISPGYPGAGSWHLPGGGTDFGESAAAGLLREIVEETGQQAEIVALISASHRHSAAALGPEGVPVDMHGVRVVFRATVAVPTQPIVMEENGSTTAAAWYPPAQALRLSLTEIARDCVARELVTPR